MKEENKRMIVKYLRKEYLRLDEKYKLMKHKKFVLKQFKELKEIDYKLTCLIEKECLEYMFDISRLIEWVERL